MPQTSEGKPRVRLVRLREQHVASARATCQGHRLRRTIAALHEMVMDVVGMQGLAPAGPLFARFHHGDCMVEVEAGIPLAQPIRTQGQVTASTLPGGPVLSASCAGKPADVYNAVRALRSFCNHAGLLATDGYWECYLAHPPVGGDGCDCEIALYMPVSRVRSNGRESVQGATGRGTRFGGTVEVELATEPDRSDLGRPTDPVSQCLHWRPPGDERGVALVSLPVDRPGSRAEEGMGAIDRLPRRSRTPS